jgi:multiple sugar transport system permease protein
MLTTRTAATRATAPARTAVRSRPTVLTRATVARVSANLALTCIILAFVAPMMWMFSAAINPTATMSFQWPDNPGLENFRNLGSVKRPLINSMVLSVSSAAITVLAACLCGYPLSRYKLRYGKAFLYGILLSSGLPIIALMIPTYRMYSKLGFIDSYPMVAIFMAATNLPFAIWLAKNFIDGVPMMLEEAARVDGATTGQTMRLIVAPLIRPGMAVLFTFSFIANWGNFFVPFLLTTSPKKYTASIAIYNYFSSMGGVYFGRIAAFAIIYSAPAVVLYAFVSKSLGRSLSFAGGVKE